MSQGTAAAGGSDANSLWIAAMPAVFVVIWSTGFIVARYGMPHAPPLGFLTVRYALSVPCLLLWIALAGPFGKARPAFPSWHSERAQWLHLAVTGVLMHGGYLGGVWMAVKAGMGAGPVALVVGLQPVLTALWLGSGSGRGTVSAQQWVGLLLGFAGLTMVVWEKLGAGEVRAGNLALAIVALLSITAGTLYQKRHVRPCDVRVANSVQLGAAFIVTAPLALFERGAVNWHPELFGAMAWSVLVLTLAGSSLLYILIQRGAATRVTSMMYLVPPTTALMAWALFGEALAGTVLPGLACTALGVWLVVRAR